MDLNTPRQHSLLRLKYHGIRTSVGALLYLPMRITQFEIVSSQLHNHRSMLVMQTEYISRAGTLTSAPVFTESYTLIRTIRGTEGKLPHYAKIVRKRDGYYYFVPLSHHEKCIFG